MVGEKTSLQRCDVAREPEVRKILMSVKCFARGSGAGNKMSAPILWAPGKIAFFLQENPPCP